MRDEKLLAELLEAEDEEGVLAALERRGLLKGDVRWRYLGNMPNNESLVQAQQSNSTAALVEKFTNAADAILLRQCKARGIDPRGTESPKSMSGAVEMFFGDMYEKSREEPSFDLPGLLSWFAAIWKKAVPAG
jgi:hypothetical protein